MLKLQPRPTFKTKVYISVAGEESPTAITAEFKYLTRTQVREFYEGATGKTDAQALEELLVGWEGVDADYTEENLTKLLDVYPTASSGFFEAFNRELTEAKRKN